MDPANLRASCKRYNCGGGSSIAAANTRQAIAEMQAVIDHQAQDTVRPASISSASAMAVEARLVTRYRRLRAF